MAYSNARDEIMNLGQTVYSHLNHPTKVDQSYLLNVHCARHHLL
jgi:hypothetical protein